MTNQSLKNKKIVISAGASGIGLAIVKVCLEKGATVFVSDINEKFLNKLKKNSKINKKLFVFLFLRVLKTLYILVSKRVSSLITPFLPINLMLTIFLSSFNVICSFCKVIQP